MTGPDGPPGRPVDASMLRVAASRASASSTATSSASRLPSHIAMTSSGRVPATRVPSANDDAARASARSSSAFPAPVAASTAASTCGRCETRATARSCSSAAAGTTRAPHAQASSATSRHTSRSSPSSAATTQAASANSSACPPPSPTPRSPPSGGRRRTGHAGRAGDGARRPATLTLTASVSRHVGATGPPGRSTSGTAGSGTASTSRASASATRRSAASMSGVTSNPSARACSAVVGGRAAAPDRAAGLLRGAQQRPADQPGADHAHRPLRHDGRGYAAAGSPARSRAATRSTPRSSSVTPTTWTPAGSPSGARRDRHRRPAGQVERQRQREHRGPHRHGRPPTLSAPIGVARSRVVGSTSTSTPSTAARSAGTSRRRVRSASTYWLRRLPGDGLSSRVTGGRLVVPGRSANHAACVAYASAPTISG